MANNPIAPNGKPSNLSAEQYALVRTPEFKAWFGDWENDPQNASKVVDENGEPLVVYHGTEIKSINAFNPTSYFAENYSYAKVYGLGLQYSDDMDDDEYDELINSGKENVYKVFLNIKNPLTADRKLFADNFTESPKVKKAIEDGYDGMVNTIPTTYFPFDKEQERQFLTFNERQIKLADGSNTTFDAANPDMRYADGGLIAPNGNPSNLTAQQYDLVRTPEFKAWFGDWENDPQNASKVVDDNGEPMVVYHGSNNNKITTFEFKIGKGIYSRYSSFTKNKKLAESYGSIIYEVFLKIEKPYIIEGNGEYIWKVINGSSSPDTFFDENVPLNYNGIIFEKVIDFNGRLGSKFVLDVSDVYMVRNPNQIKLADGSNTIFDAANSDMRYADGGKTGQEITCVNCGWHWNTSDSDESDKYVCHKCGFDNKAFYDPEPIGVMADGGVIVKGQLIEYNHSGGASVEAKFLSKVGENKAKIEILNNYIPYTKRVMSNQYVNPAGRTEPANFLKEVPRGTIKIVSLNLIEPITEKTFKHRAKPISKWLKSTEFKEAFGHLDNPINTMADGGSVGDFKKVKKNYLGIDESFEDVEYRYKDAAIRFNGIDNLWILTMQHDGKPEKTIGGYKTLKIAKEVGLYYLKNPKLYADGGKVDFGEVLFGEDKAVRALQPKGLTRIEPNTEDENKLQKALYDYTQSSLNKDSIIKNKSLLESAANQFPQLLRPKISPFDNNFLFRGVSFSEDNKDNIIKMLGISIEKPFGDDVIQFSNEDSNDKNAGSSVVYGKYFQNADFGIKDFEFTSWTTDYKIAKRFNRSTGFIYAVSFENSDDLYLRPKLSNAVSSYRENEMLFYNEGKEISTKRVDKDSILVRYIYILYSADNLARLLDTDIYTVRANINARPILEGSTSESALQHDLNILNKDKLQEDWFKKGGLSRTPAPKKDRVFGSDKNKVGSAASKESAKKINLSEDIITTLSNKAKEYNEENSGNKVTLNTLKAVMRRGMGAYSTSHRPTITGGAPNSRQAWGFARVNKFLKKKSGEKVKAAYVQDDDLLEMGGTINKNNLKMIQQHYHSMKPIEDIQVGDIYVIKEDMFAPHQDHEHPQHLSTRYATVEVKSPCHRNLDSYTLEVVDCDCDNAAGRYAKGKVIERSRKHILSSGKLKSAVAKAAEQTEKVGLDDIYMGDSINYDGKTYEVGGLSDCRTKVKIKLDDNESDADIDDVMDRAILIKRGN